MTISKKNNKATSVKKSGIKKNIGKYSAESLSSDDVPSDAPEQNVSNDEMQRHSISGEETETRLDFENEDSEDSDSLKLYFRHLVDSEPLSTEDELLLWQHIDDSLNEARKCLYRFAYVLLEHVKLLDSPEENIYDVFQQSALHENMRNMNNSSFLFVQIRPWIELISESYQVLKKAFSKGNENSLEKERVRIFNLLMKFPVHSDLLHEWYRVAGVFLMRLDAREAEPPYESPPMTESELESKLLMSVDEFRSNMAELAQCFARIEDSRNKILVANLRLVVSIVKHYHHSNVQMGDLIQEGNLGLIHAMEKFDFKLGHKFSTYATWWIKQAISKAVASHSRVIRLPSHMLQSISKINKAEQNFILLHGRDPTDEEIAATLELPRERVSAIKKMACQAISLQAPLSNSDGAFLENLISEGESGDPARKLAFKMMCSRLTDALETLTEREQQIIKLRFGLSNGKAMTLVEVSKMFHLTRERIRQLEYKAIKKLRDPALLVYFQDYFN